MKNKSGQYITKNITLKNDIDYSLTQGVIFRE